MSQHGGIPVVLVGKTQDMARHVTDNLQPEVEG